MEEVKTQCIKVGELRKIYGKDINLEKWMDMPNNLYVGRRGRIFITHPDKIKTVFVYPQSKWANPYKSKDHGLDNSVRLYRDYVISSGLIDDIHELKGNTLGCFCDQNNKCHAKVLKELYNATPKILDS